jgi:GTP-binding protein EngB required for normal cell division
MSRNTQQQREFNIKRFDMRKIKKESIIIILGKRNTGKSFLTKDILYYLRDIPIGTVISKTDHLCHWYDRFIPGMLIYKTYDPVVIDKLFKRQEKALEENWANPYAFLLLDDVLSEAKQFTKDPRIDEIFFNGRHYKLLFILAMQSPMGIPPGYRTNIDYTFILKNTNGADRERIYKNYAGMFSSREEFEIILDNCTEDYGCLVIDNTSRSSKLEDQVFYYKAEPHDDFKMCSNKLWQINNSNYNSDNKGYRYNENTNRTVVNSRKGQVIINKK